MQTDSHKAQHELQQLPRFVIQFFQSPLSHMKTPPDFEWQTLFILLTAGSAASGCLSGVLQHSLANMISGIIVLPITALIMVGGIGVLIRFILFEWRRMDLELKKIITQLILAVLPFLILRIFASLVPVIEIIALGCTTGLLYVGFTQGMQVDRRFALRLLGGVYAVLFSSWLYHQIRQAQLTQRPHNEVTPESWQILEREVSH